MTGLGDLVKQMKDAMRAFDGSIVSASTGAISPATPASQAADDAALTGVINTVIADLPFPITTTIFGIQVSYDLAKTQALVGKIIPILRPAVTATTVP